MFELSGGRDLPVGGVGAVADAEADLPVGGVGAAADAEATAESPGRSSFSRVRAPPPVAARAKALWSARRGLQIPLLSTNMPICLAEASQA